MLKLLTPLLTSVAAGEVGLALNRAKRSAIFMGLIAILLLIGVVFLLVAAYIFLAGRYGPLNASLIIAGCTIGLAIIIYIIMKISEAAIRKRQRERAKVDTSALLTIAALAAAPAVMRSRGLLMLAVPILAFGGLTFLRKPKRRPSRNNTSAGDGI